MAFPKIHVHFDAKELDDSKVKNFHFSCGWGFYTFLLELKEDQDRILRNSPYLMGTIVAESSRPWIGIPYKAITRPRDNNGVVALCHHRKNPQLFMGFHRWEESYYVKRSPNGYSRVRVQGDSTNPSLIKA